MKNEYLNHKDFIKSLKNPSLDIYHKVYHKNKKEPIHHPGDKTVKTSRLDRIEKSITKLATEMNARFDNIEKRFDYVIKANNLKDLPEQKRIKK